MRYVLLEQFSWQLESFPTSVQNKFWKQLAYLLRDIRYPFLYAKKYDESRGVWQARIDENIRFYFLIEKDVYYLLDIKHHPK